MKKLILALLLMGCGAKIPNTTDCVAGSQCNHDYVNDRGTVSETVNSSGTSTACDTSQEGFAVCGGVVYQIPAHVAPPKDGKNGLNSLIASYPFTSDNTVCVSGSGIVMNTGLDSNSNGILDTPEVAQTSVVCNGATGAIGAKGVAGTSCSIDQLNDGAQINCTDGSVANIKDGLDGAIGQTGLAGAPGANCSIQSVSGGQQITCGPSVANILNGVDGINGTNGSNGSSCSTVQTLTGALVTCTNGTTANLLNGAQGIQGVTGTAGLAGTNCSVTAVSGGSKITCGSTSSVVTNGVAGAQGIQGVAGTNATSGAYNIVRVIEPCGHNSSPWKEVLLLLASGDILASFSDTASGLNTRLAFIPNNNSYIDTDNSGCNFSISGVGPLRVISWGAGHNQFATWAAAAVSAAL